MSRNHEIPKPEGIGHDNSLATAERQQDPVRSGLSREAARREMDRFRGPAEYSVRKILGRRSAADKTNSAIEMDQ